MHHKDDSLSFLLGKIISPLGCLGTLRYTRTGKYVRYTFNISGVKKGYGYIVKDVIFVVPDVVVFTVWWDL